MANVIEMVTSIMEMDKKIESLKRENQLLKEQNNLKQSTCDCEHVPCCGSSVDKESYIDNLVIEMGLKALYEKLFYSWKKVTATRGENGEIEYTSFDKFVEEDFRRDEVPEKISKFECLEKLKPLLMKKYEEECVKAYDRLLENEKQDEE